MLVLISCLAKFNSEELNGKIAIWRWTLRTPHPRAPPAMKHIRSYSRSKSYFFRFYIFRKFKLLFIKHNFHFETLMWRSTQKRINAGLFIVIMFRECCDSEGDATALKHLNSECNLLSYSKTLSRKAFLFPHVTGSHLLCLGLFQRLTSSSWVKTSLTLKWLRWRRKKKKIQTSKCF